MKVLFDQNVPRNLSRHLPRHKVLTAASVGWEELKNGDLLNAAESQDFEVLIECDQSLRYQQNLTGRKISVVELYRNNWPLIEPHVAEVADAVDTSSAGAYRESVALLPSNRRRGDNRFLRQGPR